MLNIHRHRLYGKQQHQRATADQFTGVQAPWSGLKANKSYVIFYSFHYSPFISYIFVSTRLEQWPATAQLQSAW